MLFSLWYHDDVIKWKHFPRYWPFARGFHRSPVKSPHKGQWRGALMFSVISAWINGWVNNREAGDLRRHQVHCDVIVMHDHPKLVPPYASATLRYAIWDGETSTLCPVDWSLSHYMHLQVLRVLDPVPESFYNYDYVETAGTRKYTLGNPLYHLGKNTTPTSVLMLTWKMFISTDLTEYRRTTFTTPTHWRQELL